MVKSNFILNTTTEISDTRNYILAFLLMVVFDFGSLRGISFILGPSCLTTNSAQGPETAFPLLSQCKSTILILCNVLKISSIVYVRMALFSIGQILQTIHKMPCIKCHTNNVSHVTQMLKSKNYVSR